MVLSPFQAVEGLVDCLKSRARRAHVSPFGVYPAGKFQWHFPCGFDFRHSLRLSFAAVLSVLKGLGVKENLVLEDPIRHSIKEKSKENSVTEKPKENTMTDYPKENPITTFLMSSPSLKTLQSTLSLRTRRSLKTFNDFCAPQKTLFGILVIEWGIRINIHLRILVLEDLVLMLLSLKNWSKNFFS